MRISESITVTVLAIVNVRKGKRWTRGCDYTMARMRGESREERESERRRHYLYSRDRKSLS